MDKKFETLTRKIHPMPDYIKKALADNGLMEKYHQRPAYQQNDYIGWITRAKLQETRQRRLNQMIAELMLGDRYMKMPWKNNHSQTH